VSSVDVQQCMKNRKPPQRTLRSVY